MDLTKLYEHMVNVGHTKKDLADLLNITKCQLDTKIRSFKGCPFSGKYIKLMVDCYGLTGDEVMEIFYGNDVDADIPDSILNVSSVKKQNVCDTEISEKIKQIESLSDDIKRIKKEIDSIDFRKLTDSISDIMKRLETVESNLSATGGMTEEYVVEQMKKPDSTLFMGIYSTVGYAVYMKIRDEMQSAGIFSVEQRNEILRMVRDVVKSMGVREVSLDEIQPVKSTPVKVKGMVDDDMTFESAEDAWKALHVD